MNNFGKKIRFFRERLDLTQKQLAQLLSMTPTTITRLEKMEEPNVRQVRDIAGLAIALHTTTDNLFDAQCCRSRRYYGYSAFP